MEIRDSFEARKNETNVEVSEPGLLSQRHSKTKTKDSIAKKQIKRALHGCDGQAGCPTVVSKRQQSGEIMNRQKSRNDPTLGMMVTRLAWMAQRFVSSKRPTRYAKSSDQDEISTEMEKSHKRCIEKSNNIISKIHGGKSTFRCLLKGTNGRRLKTQVGLEVLGNFTDQTLKWKLADQKLCALLELSNFAKSHGTRAVAMGLLHSSRNGGALPTRSNPRNGAE